MNHKNLQTDLSTGQRYINHVLFDMIFIRSLSPKFNHPLYVPLRDSRHPGLTERGRKLTLDHVHTYLTTQGDGGSPRMRDQFNAGATSETTKIWKTIHTIHAPIHSNKSNMKGWLWRPNDIRGPSGPKTSWHLSYRWGKTPEKPHPGNSSRPGIKPGPAAGQARMLPPAPQRRTGENAFVENKLKTRIGWIPNFVESSF